MTADPDRLALFRWMVLARTLDDRMAKLKAQAEVPGSVFLGRGQEAFSAAAGMRLRRGDIFAPLIRDQAGRLAFGETPLDAVRCVLGRRTGWMRGRDGNIHRGDWGIGLVPMISHLGAMVSVVAGVLLARRLAGKGRPEDLDVGVVSIGDGGMATGSLHEGLNAAAVERLPLVLLVANNQYSYSTTPRPLLRLQGSRRPRRRLWRHRPQLRRHRRRRLPGHGRCRYQCGAARRGRATGGRRPPPSGRPWHPR